MAAARGAWAFGSVLRLLARVVRVVTALITLLIVVAILLRVLGANAHNTVVSDIHDAASFFVGPLHNVFSIKQPKLSIAINWGIAAALYSVIGSVVASLIRRLAPRGAAPADPVD